MKNRMALVCSLSIAAAVAVGCGSDPASDFTGGGDTIDSQMADISLETDQLAEAVLMDELTAMEASPAPGRSAGGDGSGTTTRTFSGTRSCPAGGSLSVEASLTRTYDGPTQTMEAEGNGSRTLTDCTFVRNEFTIVVDGSANWDIFRRRVGGIPDGPQTSHYAGSFTAERSDGEVRTCSFDYTIVRDPGARSRTAEGTLCGIPFRRGIGWGLNG